MKQIFAGGKKVPLALYTVPCGECAFCLQNRRSAWMFRVHHEMRTQEYPGWFITMTYDEKHVPRRGDRLSLRFRDVQLFLKRVRKANYYAKYICVGEYGGQTGRPHYHILLWTDAPPLVLESHWKLGRFHFGQLTMASAMYTLKYIIQPRVRKDDVVEPTRAQFSKGLGLAFLSCAQYEHLTSDFDNPEMFSYIDGKKVAIPRYYRSKIFISVQLKRYAQKAKWDSIRARREKIRDVIRKGIVPRGTVSKSGRLSAAPGKKAVEYLDALRSEQAVRIIRKTKFNLTI